ncbi:hypothetical protein KY343_01990 [Candidatus Woesearchaeota archaeon]|nr:hypothetical protein [Candidatus Woesearchaeota archaeon]
MAYKIAPLHGSFMLTAIIGFLITVFLILPNYTDWGITLVIFFAVMFIAALISMTKSPVVPKKDTKK